MQNAAPAALCVALTIAMGSAPARAARTPADEAATHAYFAAVYARAQAVVANLPASKAAVEGVAGRIGGECPGVLAGALSPASSSFGPHPGEARRRGELMREDRQKFELEDELIFALTSALSQPDQQATTAFVSAVEPLQWSNPAVAQSVHVDATELKEQLGIPSPDVCADMRAWVASGYRTLSASTKELFSNREAIARRTVGVRPVLSLLAPYESAGDRALIDKTRQLERRQLSSLKTVLQVFAALRRTLGVTTPRAEEAPETASSGAKASVVIARGRTAAGGRYSVRVEPKRGHSGSAERGCVSVTVTYGRRGFSGRGGCYSRSHSSFRRGSVNCNEGLLTIEAQTAPRARTVTLRLSDGRRITSRVAVVPARLGGPVGLYYQVVRGPTPVPVSLTELGAHGETLRVVKLPRIVECTRHPLKYLPGGVRTLVHERVPQGPAFAIVGEAYRFLGHVYFDLKIHVEAESESEFGGESSSGSVIFSGVRRKPSPFAPQFETVCRPHPYEIVYGLLKAPRDTVLARSASGTTDPLRQVAIPASQHAHGELVYAALSTVPTELLVRTPSGRTVATEKLEGIATEAFETCEGEEEPTG